MTKQRAGRRTASTPCGIAPKADRTKPLRAHTRTHTLACTHNYWVAPLLHAEPLQPHVHACIMAQQMHREMQSACTRHTCNHSSCSCSPGTGRYTESRHGHVHSMHTCGCSARMQSLHANATRACKSSTHAHATAARTCNRIPMHVQSHHHAHATPAPTQHRSTHERAIAAPTQPPRRAVPRTPLPAHEHPARAPTSLPPSLPPSHTQLPDTQAYFYCSCQEHEKPFCQHSARAIYEPGLFERGGGWGVDQRRNDGRENGP